MGLIWLRDGAGFQPLWLLGITLPGATPQAGINCAVGARIRVDLIWIFHKTNVTVRTRKSGKELGKLLLKILEENSE